MWLGRGITRKAEDMGERENGMEEEGERGVRSIWSYASVRASR